MAERWTWFDGFGVFVTAATLLAVIGLTMCAACNGDDGRSPADRINGNPHPTLAPLTGPTGVHP